MITNLPVKDWFSPRLVAAFFLVPLVFLVLVQVLSVMSHDLDVEMIK